MELPVSLLEMFFVEYTEKEINDRRWEIKKALLSHTPMTKEAATSLSRELREIDQEFKRITRNLRKPPIDRSAPIVSKVLKTTYERGEKMSDYSPEKVNAQDWKTET